jgi:predicted adenine nucleotide alpha hydrolase (AANH) superfamily ATPase
VTVEEYAGAGFDPSLYFRNPNIHPYKEFARRRDAAEQFAGSRGLPIFVDGDYPLEENMAMLLGSRPRCLGCFRDRLGAAAEYARRNGFPCFGTTLSVSPYQNQEWIIKAGGEAGDEHGVEFVYIDCRPRYRESVAMSREMGLYRQPYCGCVFSERDRYRRSAGNSPRTIDTVRQNG